MTFCSEVKRLTMNNLKYNQMCFVRLTIILFVSGCGGPDNELNLGQVIGSITLDDRPLADASVIFSPETGRASVGKTDGDGRYTLQYTGDVKGALTGKHQVSITTQVDGYSDEANGGKTVEDREEILPPKYHSASILEADVVNGSNTIDFDLKSK